MFKVIVVEQNVMVKYTVGLINERRVNFNLRT